MGKLTNLGLQWVAVESFILLFTQKHSSFQASLSIQHFISTKLNCMSVLSLCKSCWAEPYLHNIRHNECIFGFLCI